MKKYLQTYLLVIVFCILHFSTQAQDTNFLNKTKFDTKKDVPANVFSRIEKGISQGDVSIISDYLNSHTYFSLANGTSGYYSSNQAYYVLEDFFKIYNVTSFKLKNIKAGDNNPYATGIYIYEYKGKRDTARVYLSLKKSSGSWKINQITIN